jgi:hypothetical protein
MEHQRNGARMGGGGAAVALSVFHVSSKVVNKCISADQSSKQVHYQFSM